ncbi:hypothetical protein SK128_026198, partial [Halocaridina rubra]
RVLECSRIFGDKEQRFSQWPHVVPAVGHEEGACGLARMLCTIDTSEPSVI